MSKQEIPIVNLNAKNDLSSSILIMENEIKDIEIEHISNTAGLTITDSTKEGYKSIYIFTKGTGSIIAEDKNYEIVPETIFLPNIIQSIEIKADEAAPLHYLKITSKLSEQDQKELEDFPAEDTQNVYYAKFSDCQSYTEPIKSPGTISRTILPNKIIPRVAMGTVQTKGPDEVGAHEHPMLEQLFLGLAGNKCTVYADDAQVEFPEHSLLHIPLGSRHSVTVDEGETLHYVWMDFFMDSKGEEWLKTHIVDEES
ncbi:hypothetical protein FUA23_06205 [Neolewinella aurantiaca]|uniref:Cupin 2 conserved barrel domain-containing protein n=1 Tax=Neolewinella aurantiaca TaxID=2602767 RepID=A0A5C7FIJ2_9BACT|nr:cupin domain-containing protein [Neolewinella aurantiaca]TXF90379.1 hypothetical protein FUA23_06205 [Neolewinella aurantiaca]